MNFERSRSIAISDSMRGMSVYLPVRQLYKDRYSERRRSISEDSYDHIRRRPNSGDFRRKPRRPSMERGIPRNVRRSRERSPEDIYSRPRRHSIEGPPSEYFMRGRRRSDEFGYERRRRYSDDYGPPRRYSDESIYRPRRYSSDSLPPVNRRIRRFLSDPYIDHLSYGRHYMPIRSGFGQAYTVYTQSPYGRVSSPVVNYVRRPVPVDYIDEQVQYMRRPYVQPLQYIERPVTQAVQYVERPVVKPVRYVQRPVVKPVEYIERPVVVDNPVITPRRYQIEGHLTPTVAGPGVFHVKYDDINTNYDVGATENVRAVTSYTSRPTIGTGATYTAYYVGKYGRQWDEFGYNFDDRDTMVANNKELDHVLYHGNGKVTKVYENGDYNTPKPRIIR